MQGLRQSRKPLNASVERAMISPNELFSRDGDAREAAMSDLETATKEWQAQARVATKLIHELLVRAEQAEQAGSVLSRLGCPQSSVLLPIVPRLVHAPGCACGGEGERTHMKLDRNINPDGKGKYALINLRKNTVEWGEPDQFFVIKYKDEFAAAALEAYAEAVRSKANMLKATGKRFEADSLYEYADEIQREAIAARDWPGKKIPD